MGNKTIIANTVNSIKKIWFQIIVGIIFILIIIIYYTDSRNTSIDNYSHLFLNTAWITENFIDHEVSRITDATNAAKRFFESSESVTRDDFRVFVGPMIAENPNIITAAWIPAVDYEMKELYEHKAVDDGLNDFFFSEINQHGEYEPVKIRKKYYPLFFFEGIFSRKDKFGLDLGSRENNLKLIKKAIESGKTSSSNIIYEISSQKSHTERYIDTFTPVYNKKTGPNGEQTLKGLLYIVIKIEDILKSAQIQADQEGLAFSFFEIEEDNTTLNNSTPASKSMDGRASSLYKANKLNHTHEVRFADKKYIFTFSTSTSHYSSHMEKTHHIITVMGFLGFVLFIFYLRNILATTQKNEQLEYKKAAEALRTKSLVRSIIDSIPQNICWKDRALNYLGCNSAFANSAGLKSPDEILMMKNNEIKMFINMANSEQTEKEIIRTAIPVLHEIVELCSVNGEAKWFDISRIPIFSEDNSVSGIICIYDDISAAKNADKELSITRLLLEAAFDQNPAGMILTTSENNKIKLANKSAFRFLGIDEEAAGDSLEKSYITEINPTCKIYDKNGKQIENINDTPLARTLRGEKIINEEHRIIKNNGAVAWGIVNGTPIYDENSKIIAGLVVFPDITSRKEMEDKLKIKEEKYRALFEQSNTGVFLYNHNFEITDCNEQLALTIGTPKEKMIGFSIRKLKDQRIMPALEKAMQGQKASYEGDYNTTTSGFSIRVSFIALPIMNSSNEIAFGCAVVENITEKWLTQKALLEKNEELDKFFTNSLDLLCIAGTDSTFKRLNPQWKTTLGYSIEDMIGRSFWDFVHPEDIEKTKEAVSALVTAKKVVDFVNRYRCNDGSYKWIEWRSYPSGNTIYAAARDITARKNTEDEIRMREELFRTLSEMAPIGIFLANEIGEIVLTNRRWLEITGVTSDETLGNGWIKYIHSDDAAKIKSILGDAIHFDHDAETEFRFLRPDGDTKNILIKGTPIIKDDGFLSGFVGTIEDITDRKKNEAEKEHLLFELGQKNTELEGIVYAASHDLRAPLVNIQGFSIRIEKLTNELSNLIKSGCDPEKCIPIIETKIPNATNYIKISASKMDALIKGLLQVARIGRRPLIPETIDMNKMIETILLSMAFQIQESGAKVICHPLPECKGDIHQLNQAFSNLIDNAFKYFNPERKLEITISGYRKEEKSIYIIEDTGYGISDDQKNKIWGMFYRISPAGPVTGEGLGLTMVKKIIGRHGGKVWVESCTTGAKFFIELKY